MVYYTRKKEREAKQMFVVGLIVTVIAIIVETVKEWKNGCF